MYPAVKEKDPVHSGTGVFYQAIPAVGSDGRNIMKLIPVQMSNGHFFKSQISQFNTIITPPKALTVNFTSAPVGMGQKAALNTSATEQIVRKQVSLMNASPYQVGSDLGYSLNKHPLQQLQQSVNVLAIVPPMALPVANSGKSVRPPCQLPVPVNSLAPPRGQCLQIVPQAQVRTVPVNSPTPPRGQCLQILPQAQLQTVPVKSLAPPRGQCLQILTQAQVQTVPVKSPAPPRGQCLQILTPAQVRTLPVKSPAPPRGQCLQILPQAQVRTLPASALSAAINKQTSTPSAKFICKTSNTSWGLPSKGSEPHFVPNVPQRPNSPIKWAVEEEDNSTVPTLDPIGSSVASDILRDLARRENTGKHCEVIIKSVTGSSQGKSGEEQGNTLVVCNGKQQQQSVHLMTIVPLMATPVANNGKSGRPPCDLQVPVTSPALPRGQCLQVPPKVQVRTVPASHLPSAINKQTLPPSANSSPSSGSPSAVNMSPITSVNRGVTPQSDSALDKLKLLCKTSSTTSCRTPLTGSEAHLKLIPNVPQRPNSPIKWSVEEDDDDDNNNSTALDAIDSSVTLEILRVAAERENAGKHSDVLTNPVSGSSRGESGQGEEKLLVTWNGKLFVLARNCSLPYKTGKSDAPVTARKSSELDKPIVASTHQSLASVAPQKKQALGILNPNQSHKVIDLCDDDAPNDSAQQAASVRMSAVPPADEDNVIFVSYTPPKSESQDLRPTTQMTHVKETVQAATSSSNDVTEKQKSPSGTPGQSMSVNTVKNHTHVDVSATMRMDEDDCSNVNSRRSPFAQQVESMEVDPSSDGICVGMKEDSHNVESPMTSRTSPLAPESCQRPDDLLRRIFGVTADVRICLQRFDEASAGSLPAEPPESERIKSAEDHQDASSGFNDGERFLRHLYSQRETESCNGLINAKRVKELAQRELSEHSATPSPHSDVGPLQCSHFKENTSPSPKGTCRDVETEPMIGYVEPIDEDFLSAEEEDFPDSRDTAGRSQTCKVQSANTGRLGRKRKRPTCPCCIPGAQDPAARSGAKSEEPEKWAWTTERTSKKGGRAKASSKDLKTSGSAGCLTAKNKHSCKASEDPASLASTSGDSDELKLHEQISRLKELLQEKEAALELMRNGRAEVDQPTLQTPNVLTK